MTSVNLRVASSDLIMEPWPALVGVKVWSDVVCFMLA
jgi:hypothetical protein